MGPRLAVLDMVGTTVQSGRAVPEAFREAFRRVGVSLSEEAVEGVRGRSKTEAIADLVSAYLSGVDRPSEISRRIHADFRAILQTHYEAETKEVPGAAAAIADLKHKGLQVVLSTGLDRDTATRILHGLGWDAIDVSGVVTGDDVVHGRPAPDTIRAAMALVSLQDAASVLVVGDTVSDLEAAARAEVGWSIGVLTGAHSRERLSSVPHSAVLESVALVPGWLDHCDAVL